MIRQTAQKTCSLKVGTPSRLLQLIALICLVLPLSACNGQSDTNNSPTVLPGAQPISANTPATPGTTATDGNAPTQDEILQAQQARERKVQVTVGAYVLKTLRDDTKGIPHERFLIQLNNGTTVLVAHDTAMAPYVPLHQGDFVRIHGEYIWNEKGGVLHWTHHTDTPRHEGGWIDLNGKRYE